MKRCNLCNQEMKETQRQPKWKSYLCLNAKCMNYNKMTIINNGIEDEVLDFLGGFKK